MVLVAEDKSAQPLVSVTVEVATTVVVAPFTWTVILPLLLKSGVPTEGATLLTVKELVWLDDPPLCQSEIKVQ